MLIGLHSPRYKETSNIKHCSPLASDLLAWIPGRAWSGKKKEAKSHYKEN